MRGQSFHSRTWPVLEGFLRALMRFSARLGVLDDLLTHKLVVPLFVRVIRKLEHRDEFIEHLAAIADERVPEHGLIRLLPRQIVDDDLEARVWKFAHTFPPVLQIARGTGFNLGFSGR